MEDRKSCKPRFKNNFSEHLNKIYFCEYTPDDLPPAMLQVVWRFREMLDTGEDYTPKKLADAFNKEFHMNTFWSTWRKYFPVKTKMVWGQLRVLGVMEEIQKNPNRPIADLQYSFGFLSEHSFRIRFREGAGMNPSEYKKLFGGRRVNAK